MKHHRYTDRRALRVLLVPLALALTACVTVAAAARAGGVDPLLRPLVIALLDQLGVTTNGVYSGPSSAGPTAYGAGTAAAPAYSFLGDTDTGMYETGANSLGFSTGGTLRATLDSTGLALVGLSTATNLRRGSGSPEAVVTGNVGDLYQNTAGGTGTTLYYKGSGAGTNTGWIAIAAGGSDTPWSVDHNANGKNLTSVNNLSFGSTTTITAGDVITSPSEWNFTGFLHSKTLTTQKTADFSLTSAQCRGDVYLVNGSGMVTATLPASPVAGDHVTFIYWGSTSNALKVLKGGSPTIDTEVAIGNAYVHTNRTNSRLELVYNDDGEWDAVTCAGTWRHGVTTGAGYAYTTTAWTAYTPTSTWSTNTTWNGFYRQVGSDLEMMERADFTGAPNNVQLGMNMPAGFTVNETTLVSCGGNTIVGYGMLRNVDATGFQYPCKLIYFASDDVTYGYDDTLAPMTSFDGTSVTTAFQLVVHRTVPVN